MRLTLQDCATGITKQVTVDTAILCDICQGKGTHADSRPATCDTCGGRGEIRRRSLLGQIVLLAAVPCAGVGEVIPNPCHHCGGDGRVRARREISVKIPAGVGDGMRWPAPRAKIGSGGPAGDLYVEVHEQQHEHFVRDGDDLHCTVSVPMYDAAWAPPSPSPGSSTTNSRSPWPRHRPARSPRCAVRVCRGCGPDLRGDLHAHIEVMVPGKLDAHNRELLDELKTRSAEQAGVKSMRTPPVEAGGGGGLFGRN